MNMYNLGKNLANIWYFIFRLYLYLMSISGCFIVSWLLLNDFKNNRLGAFSLISDLFFIFLAFVCISYIFYKVYFLDEKNETK